MQNNKPETVAITVNDKAAAFDRIAEAYLDIPAGTPPADEVAKAERNLIDVVGRHVQRLHPAYGAPRG